MAIARQHTGAVPHRRRFTLVEFVAALIITGVLLSLAGLGLVSVARGFERARTSGETAQKAQLAVARMTRELTQNCTVTASSASSLTFTSAHYPGGQTISLAGTNLLLGADILVDRVSAFTVAVAAGPPPAITLTLRLADTASVTYAATVYP